MHYAKLWSCSQSSYLSRLCETSQTSCVFSLQTVTCEIAPRLYTHTYAHTHTVSSTCWQIKVQSCSSLNQYTHSWDPTHYVCALTCLKLFPHCDQTVPESASFDANVSKAPVRHWSDGFTGGSWMWCLCWWWVPGAGVSYHASTWTGRQIHCEGEGWGCTVWCAHSMGCCTNTQSWWMNGVTCAKWVYHSLSFWWLSNSC